MNTFYEIQYCINKINYFHSELRYFQILTIAAHFAQYNGDLFYMLDDTLLKGLKAFVQQCEDKNATNK